MVQQIKLLLRTAVSQTGMPVPEPAIYFLIQLPTTVFGKAAEAGPSPWVCAAIIGNPGRPLDARPQPFHVLDFATI